MNLAYSSFAIFTIIGFASIVYHYTARKKKKTTPRHRKKQINDVIMFSEAQSEMVASKYSKSLVHPSMDRLMTYLSLARYSLDICMYVITNCDIAHMITKLHNRGVYIRVIVDADMAYATGSVTKRIEKQGIELRWMKSTNLMHHKFCIVDASHDVKDTVIPFAMIGSLNWTTQAVKNNWENVLVTSKPAIVQGLKDEFEKLWIKFKPIDSNYFNITKSAPNS